MKRYLGIGLVILLIIFGGVALYKVNNKDCQNYIKEEYKITDNVPKYTNYSYTSPTDDSILEEIVLIEEADYSTDSPHREAYYSQTEDSFWIADSRGMFGKEWYGPFKGRPC